MNRMLLVPFGQGFVVSGLTLTIKEGFKMLVSVKGLFIGYDEYTNPTSGKTSKAIHVCVLGQRPEVIRCGIDTQNKPHEAMAIAQKVQTATPGTPITVDLDKGKGEKGEFYILKELVELGGKKAAA